MSLLAPYILHGSGGGGGGPLFEDDFTSQTLATNLADDADWTREAGFLDVKVEDASGTRVARSPSGVTQTARLEVQGTYPAARKVTVDLHSVRAGGTAGAALTVYLNYIDASNYTSIAIDTSGFTSVRHRVAASNEASDDISGSVWAAGEQLVATLDGGTLTVTVDAVAIGASPWTGLTMPTAAQPGALWNANSADTTRTAISLFRVENP